MCEVKPSYRVSTILGRLLQAYIEALGAESSAKRNTQVTIKENTIHYFTITKRKCTDFCYYYMLYVTVYVETKYYGKRMLSSRLFFLFVMFVIGISIRLVRICQYLNRVSTYD